MKCLLLIVFTQVALAQLPEPAKPVAHTWPDSTLLVLPTGQYDFYYSAKQAEQYERLSIASYTIKDRIAKHRFRDKTYTEVIPKGLKPMSQFDDYVLIGSGTMQEVKNNGEW